MSHFPCFPHAARRLPPRPPLSSPATPHNLAGRPEHTCAVSPARAGAPVLTHAPSHLAGGLNSRLLLTHRPHLRGSCSLRPRSTRVPAAAAWAPSASRWQLRVLSGGVRPISASGGMKGGGLCAPGTPPPPPAAPRAFAPPPRGVA